MIKKGKKQLNCNITFPAQEYGENEMVSLLMTSFTVMVAWTGSQSHFFFFFFFLWAKKGKEDNQMWNPYLGVTAAKAIQLYKKCRLKYIKWNRVDHLVYGIYQRKLALNHKQPYYSKKHGLWIEGSCNKIKYQLFRSYKNSWNKFCSDQKFFVTVSTHEDTNDISKKRKQMT